MDLHQFTVVEYNLARYAFDEIRSVVILAWTDSKTLRTNKKCPILQYCALAVYTWIHYCMRVEEKYPWVSPNGDFSLLPTSVVKLFCQSGWIEALV